MCVSGAVTNREKKNENKENSLHRMSGAFGGAFHKDKLDSPSTGSEDGNLGMAGIELPVGIVSEC